MVNSPDRFYGPIPRGPAGQPGACTGRAPRAGEARRRSYARASEFRGPFFYLLRSSWDLDLNHDPLP